MKEYDEQLEKRLNGLGDLIRSQPSVTKNGMRTIEQTEQVKMLRPGGFFTPLVKSWLGLAACLLIGAFLWLVVAGSNNVTLADVQKSLDSKTWVLVQYENGAKEWANLPERRSFYTSQDANGCNFYAGMRDHVYGIWRYYHSNHGEQIHEKTFTPRPYPQTPWEYAVGDWDNNGRGQLAHQTVEKSADTIDDRQVVRFDTYNVGPLGLRSLSRQVWADPQTRLPVRIRKYTGPKPEEFDTGDFSFPRTGPSSIYDLGAPEGLEVVSNWGVMGPAKAIIDGAKQAQQQLPLQMRIIEKSKYRLSISCRYGNKFRSETYGQTDANHNNLLPLELPENNEQIHEWASNNLTLFKLCIFDGQYKYSYSTGDWLWESSEKPEPIKLDVRYYGPDWIYVLLPIREYWPYITNVGPMKVLEDQPGIPQGCLLLRWEEDSKIRSIRRDWYVDPERDYICVKQSEWRKDKQTNQWVEEENHEQAERTDLTRLASGQWYARTIKKIDYRPGIIKLDVKLLSDSEMEQLIDKNDSNGFFNGEKLLKNAMDNGVKVTFWED